MLGLYIKLTTINLQHHSVVIFFIFFWKLFLAHTLLQISGEIYINFSQTMWSINWQCKAASIAESQMARAWKEAELGRLAHLHTSLDRLCTIMIVILIIIKFRLFYQTSRANRNLIFKGYFWCTKLFCVVRNADFGRVPHFRRSFVPNCAQNNF